MKVHTGRDEWGPRGLDCPCQCGGNGFLVFYACPGCNAIVLVCDELGNVFDNLKDPKNSTPLVIWRSTGQNCSKCEVSKIADFQAATQEQLLAYGFEATEFELADLSSVGRIAYLAG